MVALRASARSVGGDVPSPHPAPPFGLRGRLAPLADRKSAISKGTVLQWGRVGFSPQITATDYPDA
jgi:hypothetical protein